MCLTGGFALAMSVEPSAVAPVMSRPSLPFPTNPEHRRALGLSDADFAVVQRRVDEGLCVMGLRFSGDQKYPAERFTRLRDSLGERFEGVEIDSSPGNPWRYKSSAHSVLTEDYSDELTSPTRRALDDVLDFLASNLGFESERASPEAKSVSASYWGMTPRQSVLVECERRSREDVARDCVAILNGQPFDDHFLRVLAGPSAETVLEERAGGVHGYWPRVWAARGLLHVWDDVATDAIIETTTDESWRVREMSPK